MRDVFIPDRTVRVWMAPLDVGPPVSTTLASTLSSDEQARAARFAFEHDRRRFFSAHGWLRTILGRILALPPLALQFARTPTGKPVLSQAAHEPALHFNLAHSEDRALIAVTRVGSVGVDLERVRPIEHAAELVERFFSAREAAQFQMLAADEQPAAFFNLWTRKEALLKATGDGLGAPLRGVEVSFRPGEPAKLVAMEGDVAEGALWTLGDLALAANFVGAVAVRAPDVGVIMSDALSRPDDLD